MPKEVATTLIAYSQMRRFEAAISDLSAYLEEEDVFYGDGMSASKALYFRRLAFTGQQNFPRAIKDFSKAIIRWPCWPEPYEARAFAFEQLGEHKKAAADREEAERRREG